MKKEKVINFLYLFFMLFVLWFFLTSSLKPAEILTGAVLSILLAALLGRQYSDLGLPPPTPARAFFAVVYFFVLFWEIIKANFDVAYRVVHPKMPIKPGIVVIKTGLKTDIAKTVLANSITLTPGTFTLDISGDKLLIHWINVRATDIKSATALIGGRFEKYLRRIFLP